MAKDKMQSSGLPEKREPDGLAGAQGKDFSGFDFLDISIEGQNFFESIFNGCLFDGIRASQSVFQHAEFTETRLSNCVFEDTSFDHSDFVLTSVSGSEFVRCSFQNAEWRDADFDGVKFRQCIFRNTTTSLARFRLCSFDDASAASFVGASKRFSLFSETSFRLPHQYLSFLRNNFGIRSQESSSAVASEVQDPFFQLSIMYYTGTLTVEKFYHLILDILSRITAGDAGTQRLRIRYMSGICKLLLDADFLSVFAIQLLESELTRIAALIKDPDQALEMISLILPLRVALRERVMAVENEVSELSEILPSKLRLQLEFENTYQRDSIDEYMNQMAAYCGLSNNNVTVEGIRPGSTFAEVVITAATFIPDLVRFLKYSLSLATVTLLQMGKLRDAYRSLTSGSAKPAKAVKAVKTAKATKSISQLGGRARKGRKELLSESVAKEITGNKLDSAKPVEIFVDTAGERVLIVGGKARVTISII
jgi:Pentapeptide repeats (8 copies)